MDATMKLSSKQILHRLGTGQSIQSVCEAAGISANEFDAWWQAETAARLPSMSGGRRATVQHPVRIERNSWGIPSIFAEDNEDLFFGFGYAMAQDRLFQLDYLRRRSAGR